MAFTAAGASAQGVGLSGPALSSGRSNPMGAPEPVRPTLTTPYDGAIAAYRAGRVDEALQRACGSDVGACQAGVQTCNAGAYGVCDGEIVAAAEVCNNVDDNCNGATDENVSQRCGSDVGECVRGTQVCNAGQFGVCAGEVAPRAELCNGLDDDCDGRTDEGFAGLADDPDDAFLDANCDGIDGDATLAVFVDATSGLDTNPGTRAAH
jgi:hypothetical protein